MKATKKKWNIEWNAGVKGKEEFKNLQVGKITIILENKPFVNYKSSSVISLLFYTSLILDGHHLFYYIKLNNIVIYVTRNK